MAPSESDRRDRKAFDALPTGTPPPGLDTRIRAQAHAPVAPRRQHRLPLLAGSLATVVLAALLVRPLWQGAPDPVTAATPSTLGDTQVESAESVEAASANDTVVFERADNAVAAVADSRNRSFDAERTLGAGAGTETAKAFSQMAKSRVAETAERVESIAAEVHSVSADTWWEQIRTLIEFGHADKAQREFRRLQATHPEFELPDDLSTAERSALGLSDEE